MGVEQHLVGLQQVGTQEESAAMAQLELSHLQLVRSPAMTAQSSLQSN